MIDVKINHRCIYLMPDTWKGHKAARLEFRMVYWPIGGVPTWYTVSETEDYECLEPTHEVAQIFTRTIAIKKAEYLKYTLIHPGEIERWAKKEYKRVSSKCHNTGGQLEFW